ncbi:eukaryotic translation initiation factor 4B isoform X2 [Zerene cesonia]|uniref:eukaryotic translation initiation factor 4B isoform X2 n=1 Tax=Zerene cesonia TaxID=33412 RepID=UPI0018E578D6|nr:eukaryotic translation initiation factor 4B isoform X2 [Zerene cesonia]
MAATGKKTKKPKWVKANITDIIAEPTTIATSNSWADPADEEPSYGHSGSRTRTQVVLPSASRAARGGLAVDDESIPKRPPYIAHISNLPYDVDDSAISDLFAGLKISNLRLPREGDRLKGFGYVDFEDRESLVNAMNISDLTIGGRRIRIEVYTKENDRRGMGRSGRSDRDRDYDPERTMGDWRSGPRAVPEPSRARPPDRDNRDRDRDRERDRERDSSVDNKPGAWRDAERPAEPPRTPYGGRDSYGRDRYADREQRGYGRDGERSGYGGRDGFRTAEREGGFSRDSRGFGSRGFGDRDRDRDPPKEAEKPRERPKLNLLPRTVPREPEPAADERAPKAAPAVFGGAKPVDTAAKEREIEERLRKQEEESRRAADEKSRWGRKNDHSGDRRSAPRRDERPRDTRSYNRERRDYSKDDKDSRDYSRDSRDKRDYSRDKEYRDERDGREHSGDRAPSRDRSPERPERDCGRESGGEGEGEGERNGRPSRSRDRRDSADDKPLPKLKEQEKPNFIASNKFSFLEDADDGGSD